MIITSESSPVSDSVLSARDLQAHFQKLAILAQTYTSEVKHSSFAGTSVILPGLLLTICYQLHFSSFHPSQRLH